jgi:nitrate reductase NapE component
MTTYDRTMNLEPSHQAESAQQKRQRPGLMAFIKSGAILPSIVLPVIAVCVIGTIGFIVTRAVQNGGLMPRPTALDSFVCKGFPSPFNMVFRHGMDVVQLRTSTVTLYGDLLNGKIAWEALPNAIAQLGFMPPSEIVYDDANTLRLIDASATTRTERVCERRS